MASRVKEDEKNERIIRGLLKLPENRRCINCNSLGPQYVCTNFWTFVCTTCSGIHREFTHRVKSVSMAKFTSQEVGALQEGGNQRAREIYFKEWDPQRQTGPDGSNVERLRDFIKHVYVDRRYSGDRNYGKSPSAKGEREDSYENRRADTYQGGSRSPSYEDTYDRRYNDRSSPGGRSPGYDQESRQYNDYKRSPARPEIVNDWHRENRFSNGRKFEDRRMADGESKLEGKSPERVKDPEASSPPIVRPVREILGDNVVPLRISEPPKPNVARVANGLAQTQRTASSSSLGSANGNPVEVKVETTASLIDFDAEPEPPPAVTVSQAHQTSTPQSVAQPASTSNDNNWASFDFAPEVKVSQAPSNANPLDSVLSQLSVPSSVSDHTSGIPSGSGAPIAASMGNSAILPTVSPSVASVGSASMMPFNTSAPAATPISNTTTFHPVGVSPTAPGLAPTIPNGRINEAGQWSSMQHSQPSFFPASVSQSTGQQFTPQFDAVSTTQGWNLSGTPNVQMASSAPPAGGPPVVLQPAPGLTSTSASQPSTLDAESIGRKELPVDLFTATYPSFPAHYPGWQTVPPRAMGFMMQYNNAPMLMPTYAQPSKSSNPFDVVEAPVQPQAFPSLASLQGALPQMYPSAGMQRTSSLGTPLPGWMPPQSSPYPSALPSQSPSYVSVLPSQSASFASPVPPRPHTAQQVPSNMQTLGHQGIGGFGSESAALGAISIDQQMASRFSAPPTPQPFSSVGGNPFG